MMWYEIRHMAVSGSGNSTDKTLEQMTEAGWGVRQCGHMRYIMGYGSRSARVPM